MNIDHLREFVTFSQYMNFSVAAKKLFLSQPALSSHIKALEKDLGTPLVDRASSSLTPAGRILANEASELLQMHDDVLDRVRRAPSEDPELVVAADPVGTDAAGDWAIFLQRFLKEHPFVSVRKKRCEHSSAADELEAGADCVIVYICPLPEDERRGVSFARIPSSLEGRLCLWMDEDHPLAALDKLRWSDMDGIKHPFAASLFRLWASTMKVAFLTHGVRYTTRLIAGDGSDFLFKLRDDEVQLYDTGYNRDPVMSRFPRRIAKPLADADAESRAFIAYRMDHSSPALQALLDCLEAGTS